MLPICVRARLFIKGFALAAAHLVKKLSCFPERRAHYLYLSMLFGLSVTLSEPACLQPISLCQRSSSKKDGLSNSSSKQVPRRLHQLKAYQVVRHESLCKQLSNPLTEKFTLSSSYE